MAKSESVIKKEMKEYIDKDRGAYRTWYVGITSHPERRLFDEHGVEKKAWWIYRWAYSVDAARRVEEYFIKLGCDGAPGGGDKDSRAVYAYKKTKNTNP